MKSVLDLRVERPVAGGVMLAYHGGRVVLVSGAIPGERVRAGVVRESRDVIHAAVVDVVEPDPDRRAINVDPTCGGQVYLHINYDRQLRLKAEVIQDALRRIARADNLGRVTVAPSPEHGYRMRGRLHVGASGLGFLREGTHQLCNPADTGQLLLETNHALAMVGRRLAGSNYRSILHIDFAEDIAAETRVINFHLKNPTLSKAISGWTSGCSLSGLTWSRPGSSVIKAVAGEPNIVDSVATLLPESPSIEGTIGRNARSFFQANRYLLPSLVSAVCNYVTGGPILDLYAGVGLFAVTLASLGSDEITAVERDVIARKDLTQNAKGTRRKIQVVGTSVERFLTGSSQRIPGTVIVDPPRAGLSKTVLERLVQRQAASIVYVSCDVATFARDVGRFRQAGYAVERIQAFDMFPNSAHIELLAKLES